MAEYRVVEVTRKTGTRIYYPEVKRLLFWNRFMSGDSDVVFASKEKAIEFAQAKASTTETPGSDIVWTTEHHAP